MAKMKVRPESLLGRSLITAEPAAKVIRISWMCGAAVLADGLGGVEHFPTHDAVVRLGATLQLTTRKTFLTLRIVNIL